MSDKFVIITEEAFDTLIHHKRVKKTDLLVFTAMILFSVKNKNRIVFNDKREKLAKKLNLSVASIKLSLKRLEYSGLIKPNYILRVDKNTGIEDCKVFKVIEADNWGKMEEKWKRKGTYLLRTNYILQDIGLRNFE